MFDCNGWPARRRRDSQISLVGFLTAVKLYSAFPRTVFYSYDLCKCLVCSDVYYFKAYRRRPNRTFLSGGSRLSQLLGDTGSVDVEMEAILLEHGVDTREFGPQDLPGLPSVPWSIPADEIERRRDFRSVVARPEAVLPPPRLSYVRVHLMTGRWVVHKGDAGWVVVRLNTGAIAVWLDKRKGGVCVCKDVPMQLFA